MELKNCPFRDLVKEWDEDDGDIIALICEGCVSRDECCILHAVGQMIEQLRECPFKVTDEEEDD